MLLQISEDISDDIPSEIYNNPQIGGAERDRTADPLLAKQVLSQLSYSPQTFLKFMVGLDRIELSTSRLSGVRSNHLSYRPAILIWGPCGSRFAQSSDAPKPHSSHRKILMFAFNFHQGL